MRAPSPTPDLVSRLRAALDDAGYTAGGIRILLPQVIGPVHSPRAAEVLRQRVTGNDRLSTLVKLFILGLEVPEQEATSALSPLRGEDAETLGLLDLSQGLARPSVCLAPFDDLVIAYDRYVPGREAPDVVIGIGPAPRALAALTVREPVGLALDLCSGCGIQALQAARHSDQVVATDINPRALAYTQLNVLLNGIGNVECREGDLFEPVEGERFDLIVANPPYVLSPSSELTFRDSGLPGDDISRKAIEGACRHLAEGGFASVLANWAVGSDETWWEQPERWVRGCDSWLIHYRTYDPLDYAAFWNRDTPVLENTLERWTEHLRALGIERVASGAVVMRGGSGADGWRARAVARSEIKPASAQILRMFRTNDYGSSVDDQDLRAEILHPAEGHRIETISSCDGGKYEVASRTMVADDGVRIESSLDRFGTELVALMDGHRSLNEIAEQLAERVAGDTVELVLEVAFPHVRRLLRLGLVEPMGPGPTPGYQK
jgi:methylase of polypeptide subunit release factors